MELQNVIEAFDLEDNYLILRPISPGSPSTIVNIFLKYAQWIELLNLAK